MTKLVKWVYGLVALPLIVLLGLVAIRYSEIVTLPKEVENFLPQWHLHDQTNLVFSNFLFWGSLVFILIILFLSLVFLLWPKRYTEIDLSDDDKGKLLLKKSALEGYVKSVVDANGAMTAPAVQVSIYKKRFKVKVAGQMRSRTAVVQQLSQLEQEIRDGLENFFGLSRPVQFSVAVKEVVDPKQSLVSRVE
ncbi:alkaline shock response membrane anchor protein AmaP [Streptococcus suis]|uniref:alkaline shock response membrane anchor protein AmaP n=1 Tax=Streptococcus parasuis TaxID=1501662 RepID=UPI0015546A7B|nr:alkaline shock response membrane anchor protein AmaP [Streptococcus suis]